MVRRNVRGKRSQPQPPILAANLGGRDRHAAWLAVVWISLLLGLLYPEPLFQGKVYESADTAAAEAFRQVGDAALRAGQYPLWNPYIFGGMPTFGSLAYTYGVYPPTLFFEWLHGLGLPPLLWLCGHLFFGGLGMWWLLGRWRTPWPARVLGVVVWLWSARLVAWAVHGHGSKLMAEMYMPWLLGLTWTILVKGGVRPLAMAALLLGLQFLSGHLQISFYTLLLMGLLTLWHLLWPLPPPAPPFGSAALATATGDGGASGAAGQPLAARWRRAGLMALAVGLGFTIGAALLLPVHSYTAFSTRGAGGISGGGSSPFAFATFWSLGPEDLAAMFLPAVAGFGKATYLGRMPFTENPNYLGLLVPGLAAAAWLVRGQRAAVWALATIALLALLLAMGRFSPGPYQLFYAVVPYFDKFRVPSMILVLLFLALAVLASLGAAALAEPHPDRTRWLRRAAWGFLIAGGVLLLLGWAELAQNGHREFLTRLAQRSQRAAPPVLVAAAWELHKMFLIRGGLLLLAAGGACLLASRRLGFRRTALLPILALLAAIDYWGVARLVTHPERSLFDVVRLPEGGGRLAPAARLIADWPGPALVQIDPDLATTLQEALGHGRLLPLGSDAMSNNYMTAGIRSLGGYHAAKPAAAEAVRQRLFGRAPAGALARWLGAAALTTSEPLPPQVVAMLRDRGLDLEPLGLPAGDRVVYRVREPLPRARLVDAYVLAAESDGGSLASLESFLDAVASGRHDPALAVVLAQRPEPAPLTGDQPLPVPAFLHDGLNEVVLTVEAPRPAVLVLADLDAPGWQVAVDGQPAPLLRADHVLRAVALSGGRHEVRFAFHDPALRRGLILALAGSISVAALLAAAWLGARRQDQRQPVPSECERDGSDG